ncbi:diaminopropionate ammonia-lyase [Mesorhizobium sp. M1C.F.Ca.ET.193.01.1.1]|uniref:diaminopropionate ammonia-lyase n=3 Tax=Mesorhizobium TaxID=68287 RepID=UPI000FD31E3E|nr:MULTISPECIES: diaminopropionate ammonia-lyase [unclassified Mesorhizobium]TGS91620.1 diaminopropionate ammonia-lyase [bacterium M00.F.Ca.ET.177.01.1.1]TGQ49851.1 diaminopropionate ammonia-lyase [Mesorhizobium sp. M1C.F.Ca.ET.210.01.1.1]TGQ64315.1 diaminopropionate ammonia-lyase [Mesorhizobium sp. M1C.F.Ca.ET.212.01.1.1]TGQ98051.1 diaminopropionate ammonia-lyase [Mesorhizobium sp. M1C.F.Ca.ET.204.01.1.1]TGR18275.1 diaminopropionate ammonia-lyase [Mesorhizobium sp. M1C.F.Ca.ET.196.01.1.1]
MFLLNRHPDHRQPLTPEDAATLGSAGAEEAERFLAARDNHAETPLHALPALASELGLGALYVKDEGQRLGLGSFKALGGAYAVMRLVLEEARRRLGRTVDISGLHAPDVQAIAAGMTFACATDGNHGRSVAQGASLVGARSVIFVHSGVSNERVAAIARFGAEIVRVAGDYDQSVREAARVAAERGWTVVSDTSWPGYERIPGLVMQGYTVIVREALKRLPQPPTHVFLQAGVGGFAAAIAGHLAIVLGEDRPRAIVVEPARAACIYETAKAGRPVAIAHSKPTVMAMLECYEPSLVAWRVLSRIGDAFMTVDEEDAVLVMNRLARPSGNDPAIVSGESGGAGLAGLIRAAGDEKMRAALHLDAHSRVLIINSEGATDPGRYADLVGIAPQEVARARQLA